MAVAVKSDPDVARGSRPLGLVGASLFATAYVVLGFIVIHHVLPRLFDQYVIGAAGQQTLTTQSLRLLLTIAALVLWIWAWPKIFGSIPGLKAGAALGTVIMLAGLALLGLMWKIVASLGPALMGQQWIDADPSRAALYLGGGAAILVAAITAYVGYRLFTKPTTPAKLVEVEEQGWFSAWIYKKGQGIRARRWTLIGLLVLVGAGVWVYGFNRGLTMGKDWNLTFPFDGNYFIPLMRGAGLSLALVLGVIAAWFAFRLVNFPKFADFLIATDAEMNKVSWTSRKRLIQDTIVVLITVFVMTTFLLLVDLLWVRILTWLDVLQH